MLPNLQAWQGGSFYYMRSLACCTSNGMLFWAIIGGYLWWQRKPLVTCSGPAYIGDRFRPFLMDGSGGQLLIEKGTGGCDLSHVLVCYFDDRLTCLVQGCHT